MSFHLQAAEPWARHQFGAAQLGDRRRTERLIKVSQKLAANPGGTMPQAMGQADELKGAYRLWSLPEVTFEKVAQPHQELTRAACQHPGEYLLIEDTTVLDYTHHPAALELGCVGNGKGQGFEVHSTLAVRVESWTAEQRPEGSLLGLLGQRCERPRRRPKGETESQRWQRPRKSRRWGAVLKETGAPPAGCHWTYVADREADFYEPLEICLDHRIDFVIRARHDRRLAAGPGHLSQALEQAPAVGHLVMEVRARGERAARLAQVEVRQVRVDLEGPWRAGGWKAPLPGITAIAVQEINAAEGVKNPLHWVLLTSLPCENWSQVQRAIKCYCARWWIEEYHKALKSGVGAEDSQLEHPDRLEPLIAVLAIVAVRLLAAKMLARSQPEARQAVETFSPEALAILEKKVGRPQQGWTNQSVLIATAKLGGFLGRKSDGLPGWQTIWRGWHRLMWMCEGVVALQDS